MKKQTVLFGLLAGICFGVCGDNLLRNGSFEACDAAGVPRDWTLQRNHNEQCDFRSVPAAALAGERVLRIDNRLPYTANVYGMLTQWVPVEPGEAYRLSFYARGSDLNQMQIILGRAWDTRYTIGQLTPEWTRHTVEFTPRADQLENGRVNLIVITDGITDGTEIDDMQLRPAAEAAEQGTVITPAAAAVHRFLRLPPAAATALEQWARVAIPPTAEFNDPADLRAVAAWAWDDDGVRVRFEITDDAVTATGGELMWQHDAIQLRIDQEATRFPGTQESDLELGFAPTAAGVESWCWQFGRPLTAAEAEVSGGLTADGYFVLVHLKWELLARVDRARGAFSFVFTVNDADPGRERRVAFLADGIHRFKSSQYNTLAWFDQGRPQLLAVPAPDAGTECAKGELYIANCANPTPWQITTQVIDERDNRRSGVLDALRPLKSDEVMKLTYALDIAALPEGDYRLAFQAGAAAATTLNGVKLDRQRRQLEELAELATGLQALRERVGRLAPSAYYTLLDTVIERQLNAQRRDLETPVERAGIEFYLSRGDLVVPELRQVLELYEQRVRQAESGTPPPVAWRYRSSPGATRQGWFRAAASDDSGAVAERDQLLVGYGHFTGGLFPEAPSFRDEGANVIQLDIGPAAILGEPTDAAEFGAASPAGFAPIAAALDLAWEHDLTLSLLLSPHYHPQWWLERHGELQLDAGFFRYDVTHPEAKQMLKAYLDVVLAALRAHPRRAAVGSICLANEPIFTGATLDRPYTRQEFRRRLEEKFTRIADFNAQSGNHFESFDAAVAAGMANPAVAFEFRTFKRAVFAEWHGWMADQVHAVCPEIPVHSKVMIFLALEPSLRDSGIDPELIAAVTDLNGNDNFGLKQGVWANEWTTFAFYHDLQYSFGGKAIANTENHIIQDGETRSIPYWHVYNATLQQMLQGVGVIVTWVWQGDDWSFYGNPAAAGFRGNIARRPAAIAAQGMAALDGNRLIDEIQGFVRQDAEVALLYSPSSYLNDPERYAPAVRSIHEQLSFSGHKLTFLSEKQLARAEFRRVKVLIVPAARYLEPGALAGMAQLVAAGGRVITVGEALQFNPWGQPQRPDFATVAAAPEELAALLRETVTPPLLTMPVQDGVFWKSARSADGGEWINIVNYNREPRALSFTIPPGYQLFDLLAAAPVVGDRCDLEPLRPLFLKLIPAPE